MDEELIKRIEKLEKENQYFRERLHNLEEHVSEYPTFKSLCDGIEKWLKEDYFDNTVKEWIFEKYSPEVQKWVCESFAEELQNWIKDYVTERLNLEPMDCVQIVTSRIHKDDPELKCNDLAATFREHGAKVRGCYGIDVNNHCEKATFMQVSGIDLDRIMQILRAFVKTSDKTKDPECYIYFIR